MQFGSSLQDLISTRPSQPSLWGGNVYLRFAVHLHQATSLHYDLRLECSGRIFSWAIPKGPCLDPGQNRLAIRTPNHSLSCLGAEGVIRPGLRGAGPILLWDIGQYELEHTDIATQEPTIRQAVEDGLLRFTLYGTKLRGAWQIRRISERDWLLAKLADAYASQDDVLRFDCSVRSGKTLSYLS